MAIYTCEGAFTCYTGGEASISDNLLWFNYPIAFCQLIGHTILHLEPSIKKKILFRHVIIRGSSTTAPQRSDKSSSSKTGTDQSFLSGIRSSSIYCPFADCPCADCHQISEVLLMKYHAVAAQRGVLACPAVLVSSADVSVPGTLWLGGARAIEESVVSSSLRSKECDWPWRIEDHSNFQGEGNVRIVSKYRCIHYGALSSLPQVSLARFIATRWWPEDDVTLSVPVLISHETKVLGLKIS
jgi:hypothetical protein